ncbi:MAG TPA: ribonuclease P protein component [Candidatus Portnoybacteria bacterium]|jgi:ribonuclease P protein component|nr:ribonuclease P protein component [Candidatus Portnoybacteria bacterium]
MLSLKNRLKKRNDIDRVFKNGKTIAGKFIVVRAVKNQLENNRFTFVVSKKTSRKAVVRNKIKRQMRESIRKLKFKNGFDFVVIALPAIVDKKFLEIKQDINEIFNFKINKIIPK